MKQTPIWITLFWICFNGGLRNFPLVKGQSFDARLSFKGDSLRLGVPVVMRLAVRLPDGDMFVVEDREGYFRPFELVTYTELPPAVKEGYAIYLRDYTLRSFEAISPQQVTLSILHISEGDTTLKTVKSDLLPLVEMVDSLQLKTAEYTRDESMLAVKDNPNYMRGLLILLLVCVSIGLIYLSARKPLKRWYRRRQIRKEWDNIYQMYQQLEKHATSHRAYITAMDMLWRSYLYPHQPEKLKSMTTSELKLAHAKLSAYSEYEQNILQEISILKDQIIHAEQRVDTSRLGELNQQLLIVLRKSYKLRLAEVKR